jgi:hypothetical protein
MKIYLSPNTAGRYGGAFNGNLRHLGRFIQKELNISEFESSFDELRLSLSYPPMYVLPDVAGIAVDFKKHYDTLPYSRLNRRYKQIDITLKAPEFSEHFDKEEQKKYKHNFEIEPQFKDISEVELSQILIDKFLEAGEIINAKLKKEDVFNFENFKTVLLSIKQKINSDFLRELNPTQEVELFDDILNKANQLRSKRQQVDKPKNKRIRDLRVYNNGLPDKALYPYDFIYSEIFSNLLTRVGLMCPTYHHLYIIIGNTISDALKNSISVEDWYVNGIAVIDYDNYQTLSDKEKEKEVFEAIVTGLKDIATIDKLDLGLIEKVADRIKENGMGTELLFKTAENEIYQLSITYFSRSMEDGCPVFLNITDKATQRTKRQQIGKADKRQLPLWLHKIILHNKKIRIEPSKTVLGQNWLKEKQIEFEIDFK